jgi:predicted kinase
LVVLCGPPLHGKTTMAAALKEHSNFIHIDVDEIRRQHFPSTSGALLPKEAELDLMACCYAFSMETAMTFIRKGLPVVFSGTCSREAFKRPVVRFLHDHGNEFPIRLFRLDVASDAVIRDRILARAATASPSPIRDEAQYRWALSIADPWPAEVEVTPVDAGRDPGIIADQLRQHLAPLRVEPSPPEPTLGDGAHEKALVRRL